MNEVMDASSIVTSLVDDSSLSDEEKKEKAFYAGLKVNQYCDDHQFYLNEDIAVHCGMAFVATADIFDPQNSESALEDFRAAVKDSYRLIREDSGVKELDGLFRKITGSRPSSELIEGYKELKAEYEKRHNN